MFFFHYKSISDKPGRPGAVAGGGDCGGCAARTPSHHHLGSLVSFFLAFHYSLGGNWNC